MAAHRHWRLYITGGAESGGSAQIAIAEIELRAAPGGADLTGAGTASASDPTGSPPAADAFDDDPVSTFWASSGIAPYPQWLAYDLGAGNAAEVVEYTITAMGEGGGQFAPQVFRLQWSDDGAAWTDAEPSRDLTGTWSDGQTRTFTVGGGEVGYDGHRHWRVFIADGADPYGWVKLAEIELRIEAGGTDITGFGTATASQSDGLQPPWRAFDNDPDSAWSSPLSGSSYPHWIAYDFGAGITPDVAEYAVTVAAASNAPEVFRLQWSDDGLAWTDAEPSRDLTGTWSDAQTRTFTVGGGEVGAAPPLILTLSCTQQVQALTLTVAARATQQVSLRLSLALTCTQQVAPLQVQPTLTATQQVAAAAGVLTLTATQQVQAPGVLAPSPTQRPSVVALLAGMDISARLTDAVEVDREAGQAASAALSFLPLGGAVDLAQWIGATLTIDLSDGSGPVRVFSGWVTDVQYDLLRRLTVLQASDDLQRALDALPREVIDAVTPGAMWSAAAADESATGWAYAQDRMATLPADLDRDRWGALRVTPWAAAAVADYTFDADAIIDESLRVEPGRWRELINQIDITAEVRYTRRLHRERSTRWEFAGGVDTGGAMIDYLYLHSTLPDEDMIRRAAETNGWQVVAESFTQRSGRGVYGGILWEFNPATEAHPWQVLGARITAARRWTQTITETYSLRVQAPASIARFGVNAQQDRATYSAPDDQGGWEDADLPLREGGLGTPPDLAGALTAANGDRYFEDLPAGARDAAVAAVLARARVAILAAHRVHSVELSTPLLPAIDTAHTVRVQTVGVTAQGRVRQVTHRLTLGGEAVTTVRIALSQSAAGAQADDALATPALPDTWPAGPPTPALGQSGAGGTHLGGYDGAPEFIRAAPYTAAEDNPDWTGYVGNRYPAWAGSVTFDERFAVDWGEIARDPIEAAAAATYRVAIPHDTLEIAA